MQVNEVDKIAQQLLSDLKGYADLGAKIAELLKDLKQQHQELFDSWTSEVMEKISDSTLRQVSNKKLLYRGEGEGGAPKQGNSEEISALYEYPIFDDH